VKNSAAEVSFRYRIRFSVTGRVRFLSHLEIVDVWLSVFRRAGVIFEFSQGMKPKPLIKLALPRPVAVEGWNEIVEIETAGESDTDALALRLTEALPSGLDLVSIERCAEDEKPAASRVAGAVYRIELDGIDPADLASACTALGAMDSYEVERRTPKQHRQVDVRAYIEAVAQMDDSTVIRFYAALTETGSVKPDEVVKALSHIASRDMRTVRTIREQIVLSHAGLPSTEAVTSQLALVGADVPEGPAKPWGSC
jgi:radical SAM-linked protein